MRIEAVTSDGRSSTVRSAVTNGRRIANGLDGRTVAARRFRDLIVSLAADLGGLDALNEGERALIRNAAAMVVRSEDLQAATLRGEAVDPSDLIRLTDAVASVLDRLRKPDPEKEA